MLKNTQSAVDKAPAGKHGLGGGLWLQKRDAKAGRWFFLYTSPITEKRREFGLGKYPDLTLKEAQDAARDGRKLVGENRDPIDEKKRERTKLVRLRDVATDAFEARKASLKSDGKAGGWFAPLDRHILAHIGDMPVEHITQHDLRDTLKPIWRTKSVTARKALNRLKIVLRHAKSLGLRFDMEICEHAEILLGSNRKKTVHIEAMPSDDVPAFYRSLNVPDSTHRAMRWLILTGARSAPVRHAHRDQIDRANAVWTIPADLMKGKVGETEDFRIPLSSQALAVLDECPDTGLLFPSARGTPLSDMTMPRLMERAGLGARPHGFRSTLRMWVETRTSTPHSVAEAMLSHKTGTAAEQAYQRDDLFEKRAAVTQLWGDFVEGKQVVVALEIKRTA